MKIIPYPDNKKFAFTFIDDTDGATIESVRTIYQRLTQAGLKVTKTIWMHEAKRKSGNPESYGNQCSGVTAQNSQYVDLLKELQADGHELALHLASGGNNVRKETIEAYEQFEQTFGQHPSVNVNHGRNADGIYWNRDIYSSPVLRWLAGLYILDRSEGHLEDSPYFWGDVCEKKSCYVRSLKSLQLNTLKKNPSMPYHERDKKYVKGWFSATDLAEPWLIEKLLTGKNLDSLVRQQGACIGYSYLHRYVQPDGTIIPQFDQCIDALSSRKSDGWYVPVTPLLNRLAAVQHLSFQRNKGHYHLISTYHEDIADVQIQGNPGQEVITQDDTIHKVSSEGTLSIPFIKGKNSVSELRGLRLREFWSMQISQLFLLLVRHMNGRRFARRGW